MTDKVPKAITQKALMQVTVLELCMSSNICMKIHEDSLKTFQVVERTRLRRNLVMVEVPWDINSRSINARVMVLALCISSNAG